MMYLTRVPLTLPELATADLADRQALHTTIMGLYPHIGSDTPRATANILYRIEPGNNRILTQATIRPGRDDLDTADLTRLTSQLQTGMPVRVQVEANPARNTKTNGRTRRYADPADRENWAIRQFQDAISLEHILAETGPVVHQRSIPIYTTHYELAGRIVDPDRFASLMRTGVGRAKAYGCGMLTVMLTP